jgi:hypothetical protein
MAMYSSARPSHPVVSVISFGWKQGAEVPSLFAGVRTVFALRIVHSLFAVAHGSLL